MNAKPNLKSLERDEESVILTFILARRFINARKTVTIEVYNWKLLKIWTLCEAVMLRSNHHLSSWIISSMIFQVWKVYIKNAVTMPVGFDVEDEM